MERETVPDTREDVQKAPEPQVIERAPWVKPEIVSFKPVTAARGISYRIGDGLSNLS
jgi:hypothetical protein